MRIFEIDDSSNQIADAASLIKRDCGPFLSQVSNRVMPALYRGIGTRGGSRGIISKVPCPANRAPVSTDRLVHNVIDEWFVDEFGIRFRSNAVFAIGDPKFAKSYGLLCAIFPIGDFQFCYSTEISDLYTAWAIFEDEHGRAIETLPEGQLIHEVESILSSANYQTTNLKRAIKSGNEVMISCSDYYVLKLGANPAQMLALLQHELDIL